MPARTPDQELESRLLRMQRRIDALESSQRTASSATTTAPSSAQSLGILPPANLQSVATVGTSSRVARENHVHQYPHPYDHAQDSADTVWTVDHALGYYPTSIYAEDDAGDELDGDVEHVSTSQLTITYTTAVSGLARVS